MASGIATEPQVGLIQLATSLTHSEVVDESTSTAAEAVHFSVISIQMHIDRLYGSQSTKLVNGVNKNQQNRFQNRPFRYDIYEISNGRVLRQIKQV